MSQQGIIQEKANKKTKQSKIIIVPYKSEIFNLLR